MFIPEINDNKGNKYSDFTLFKKGGMGEIYKGLNINSKKEVVLKLIFLDSQFKESLLQTELEVSKKFEHQNIVSSLHTGKIAIEGNDYLFMIQKFYSNGNLRTKIRENIPFDICLNMMLDILEGMKIIHSEIIHRDLKPENILVDSKNNLLITDFGLAKYINQKTRTRTFKGYGTVPYMAPECWTGDDNSILMDIYSLGVIFYEILTGKLPYNAKNETEWKECHLYTLFPDITNNRTGVTVKLNQIIQKMTNKRASQRYQSINDIIDAINTIKTHNEIKSIEIEHLASLGNTSIRFKKDRELKELQTVEKKEEFIKYLNFEISELFSMIRDKVNEVNQHLEEEKIHVNESLYNKNVSPKLTISFFDKRVVITFLNYNEIEKNDKFLKEKNIAYQEQNYGLTLNTPPDSFFKKEMISIVGLAETNFIVSKYKFGFNLLLKKKNDSNYGEWNVMQFSENITPPNTKFGIDLQDFFNAFYKFKYSPYFSNTVKVIDNDDICSLIKILLI